ncbi:MAG: ABC transporter permease subunit [Nannocystis sp.]|nr:ABC transporter permease subunit [Nannocystis sp.]
MIAAIARFELRYHLRRPVTWIYFGVLALLAFGVASSDVVRVGGASGRVHRNAPDVINWAVMILTIFGTAITSAIAGAAILRDFEARAHELLFSTPLSKRAYVGGRFIGAYVVTMMVFLGVPLGLMLGSAMPWVDADSLGPFSLAAYLWPYLVYTAPNTLLATALFFAVGITSRSLFAVYVQGMALFVGYSVAVSFLGDFESEALAALVDPFGVMPTSLINRDWTIVEKNSRLIPLTAELLTNRALWIAIAVGIFGAALRAFKMDALGRQRRRGRAKAGGGGGEAAVDLGGALALPQVSLRFGVGARLRQLASIVRLHARSTVSSPLFLAIVAIGMILMVSIAVDVDAIYGTTVYPRTYVVAEVVTESFSLFFFLLTTLYAGELLWRERGIGCALVYDALPVPTWLVLAGKILALLLVHSLLLALLMATGALIQVAKGFFEIEPAVYVGHLYGLTLPWLVAITLLTFAVHAAVNSKFMGHVVVISFWLILAVMGALDFEHNLYTFGSAPNVQYSDLNGFGPDLGPFLWFMGYWSAIGLLLVGLGGLVMQRGAEGRLGARLAAAKGRLGRGSAAFIGACALASLGLGGFIFYNTNILHKYRASDATEAIQAAYEREMKATQWQPQPRIVGITASVDLEPEAGRFAVRGEYRLRSRSDAPISEIHVVLTDEDMDVRALEFDREAALVREEPRFGLRIFKLAAPLALGEEMRLRFDLARVKGGFSNTGRSTAIVENGTFLHSSSILPRLGYMEALELSSDDTRKEQGLAPKERMAAIDDERSWMSTYIASDSDWIDLDLTVSTSPEQIALAPGYLQREWREGGRRYFHYATEGKILNFFAVLSARYEVRRDRWNEVAIEVYHHPAHAYNVERMITAVKRSLDYFTENFSPYQYRQVRILEFPRYSTFAQAFPGTIPYSESIGFIARIRDEREDIDYPFYVTAHEVAHQWWAHQVIGADVQGSALLSESLAQYSALMVMEREFGAAQMRKFLSHELRGYLRGRSAERKKEMPLMLVEDQPYIYYQKGSLAFYALKDLVGEAWLNAALRELLREHASQGPPFPTSRALIDRLRRAIPAEYAYLIEDLFETITLYDNKVESASAQALADGRFAVKATLRLRKLRADELGNESEVAIAGDFIDVGVFAAPGPDEGELGAALLLEKRRFVVKEGETTEIEVVVDRAPATFGIDPYHKLIDRHLKDNTRALSLD